MNRPARSLGLRLNFLWTLGGNLVYGLCQWGLIAIIAKLSGPEQVGQFAFALAITAPVFMFANLQLRAVQTTDAVETYRFGDYFGVRLTSSAIAFGLIVAYALFWEDPSTARSQIILWLAAAKAFEAVSDVLYGLPQREERMDRVSIALIAKGILSLVVVGIALRATGSLVVATACLAILWLVLLIALDLTICRQVYRETATEAADVPLRPTFARSAIFGILILGAPLGIARLLMSLQTSIPRFIVDDFLGERALGIFAALAYVIVIGNRFMHSLGQSVAPRLSRHHLANDGVAFRHLYFRMLAVGGAFGIAGVALAWAAGPWILQSLYGPEYAAHNLAFIWIMVAAGIGYLRIFTEYTMIVTRWIRIQVPLLLLSTLALTAGGLYWVPRMGILGAAIALVVAAATHFAGSLGVNLVILRASRV